MEGQSSRFEASIVPICAPSKKYARSEGGDSLDSAGTLKRGALDYNPLLDKGNRSYLTTPVVMQHLIKQGFMTHDGKIIPSKDEQHRMKQMQKAVNEQKSIVRRVEERKEARLDRLRKCAHVNEIVYTKGKVYEISEHGKPVVQRVMVKTEKKDKVKKSKKKKKKQFHMEKDKGSSPDTYILYPTQTSSFMNFWTPQVIPAPTVKVERDVFTTKPSLEDVRESSPPKQDLPQPVHFYLAASNVPKACRSLQEAITTREVSPMDTDRESVTVRRKQVSIPKPGELVDSLQSMESDEKVTSRPLVTSPIPLRQSVVRESRRREAAKQRVRGIKKRVVVKESVVLTDASMTSIGGEEAGYYTETYNESRQAESNNLLSEITTPPTSKPSVSKKKRKSPISSEIATQLSGYEKLKRWNYVKSKEKEKTGNASLSLEDIMKRMNEKHDSISSMIYPERGSTPSKETIRRSTPPKSSNTTPPPELILPQPEVTEVGIQTKESKTSNMSELDREDLLELLRELVVTPRQHLDSVMELIEKELSQPDVSYNKMLRHVHEYSAIDEEGPVADEAVMARENQFSKAEEHRSGSGQELQRAAGLMPSNICGTAAPALAGLAKHVVEDFMFDQNMIAGSMDNKGLTTPKKNESINYVIEHGAHGLHKALSFQPPEDNLAEIQGLSDRTSSGQTDGSRCNRTPSMASCHFNKVSGEVYHMYLRKDGSAYFSMLSPKERGASSHSSYLGSYRENKDDKMTLVASPSTLSRHSSANDIGLGEYDSCSSLDEVTCSVERVPGFKYYKYRKENGSSFLTTVSPKTWGPSCPHTFVKAYRETRSGVLVPVRAESVTSADDKMELPEIGVTADETDDINKEMGLLSLSSSPQPDSEQADCELHSKSDSAAIHVQPTAVTKRQKPVHKVFSSVECSFPRMPGKVYHLYRRSDGSTFLSTLPLRDVDKYAQGTFVASYIQNDNDQMKLVKSELHSKTKEPDPPEVISCTDSEELKSPENDPSVRSPSRELVDALLQASDDHFDNSETTSRSWIDEFLSEVNTAREYGIPTRSSEKELCEGLRTLSSKTSQRSMSLSSHSSVLENFKN